MKRTVTPHELQQPLIPYRDAVDRILADLDALAPVEVALRDALGLVAADDVVSPIDVPGFDNSAMDGFAVRAADTPGEIRLAGDIPAGTAATRGVDPGTAATIMTGAPLPAGADAVVPWEDAERDGDVIVVRAPFESGRYVRPRGEDLARGALVASSGTELGPVELGVLASIGRTSVRARPRPRVAILSTGDELVDPGKPLREGAVYDANRTLLRALCARAGADVVADERIGDDPDAIAGWLARAAADADLIVTSGGASVGEHDWIRAIIERDGTLALWRVAIKPGKPVAYGRVHATPVFALPGNPGSAFVCAHVFVRPAIRTLGGKDPAPASVRARLTETVTGSPTRTLFARVRLDGNRAEPLPAHSSVVLSNLIPAHGFAIVPPGGAAADAAVTVELL